MEYYDKVVLMDYTNDANVCSNHGLAGRDNLLWKQTFEEEGLDQFRKEHDA